MYFAEILYFVANIPVSERFQVKIVFKTTFATDGRWNFGIAVKKGSGVFKGEEHWAMQSHCIMTQIFCFTI